MPNRMLRISVISSVALALISCSSAGYDDAPAAKTLKWEDAVNLIYTGTVESAMQTHKGVVTLSTVSGERFVTQTPKMDAILRVKKGCGAPCSNLAIAME